MLERRTNGQAGAWLWRLRHDGHEFQCVIGLEEHGFQTRFLFNGKLLSEYMFGSWAEASAFAGQRRLNLESKGYMESAMKRRLPVRIDVASTTPPIPAAYMLGA